MKKLITFLTSLSLISSSVINIIACGANNKNNVNIHDAIREIVSEPIVFEDDWIIDYDIFPQEHHKEKIGDESIYYYLEKLYTKELLLKLEKSVPDLYKKYPDFTIHASACYACSIGELNDKSFKKETIQWENLLRGREWGIRVGVNYNLNSLENIDYSQIPQKNTLVYERTNPIDKFRFNFGEHWITSSANFNFKFKQKSLINSPQERLNYLSKLLNSNGKFKLFGKYYWKFFGDLFSAANATQISVTKDKFPDNNLIRLLQDKDFLTNELNRQKLINELRKNALFKNAYIGDTILNNNFIYDDIKIDIHLLNVYDPNEIQEDEKLKKIFMPITPKYFDTFKDGAAIFEIKTWLRKDKYTSDDPIVENFAASFYYR